MIVRNCAGGIVFTGDKVLLVCNDKEEWGFPKGAVKTDSDLMKLVRKTSYSLENTWKNWVLLKKLICQTEIFRTQNSRQDSCSHNIVPCRSQVPNRYPW